MTRTRRRRHEPRQYAGRAATAALTAVLVLAGCTSTPATGSNAGNAASQQQAIATGTATETQIRSAITATSSSTQTAQISSKTVLELTEADSAQPQTALNMSITGTATLDGSYADLTVNLGIENVNPVKVALRADTSWVQDPKTNTWVKNSDLQQAKQAISVGNTLAYFAEGNPLTYDGTDTVDDQETYKYSTSGPVTTPVLDALAETGALPAGLENMPASETYTANIWIDQDGLVVRTHVAISVLDVISKLPADTIDLTTISKAISTHTLEMTSIGSQAAPTSDPETPVLKR